MISYFFEIKNMIYYKSVHKADVELSSIDEAK